MDSKFVGYIAIILSLALIAFELFSLKLIQIIDFSSTGSSYTDSLTYIFETPISISILILILILIFGIVFVIKGNKK